MSAYQLMQARDRRRGTPPNGILDAARLTQGDLEERPVAVLDVLGALTDGVVEAAFILDSVPHPPVDPTGKRAPPGGIRLVDLAPVGPRATGPVGSAIPALVLRPGLYGANAAVTTVGILGLLLARPDLPEDVAAAVVDMLGTRADALVPAGSLGARYLDARSSTYTYGVPPHPGAVRAFRDRHG